MIESTAATDAGRAAAPRDHDCPEARAAMGAAVVDDDPVLALYLMAVLRAAGHRPAWYGDGESALRAFTGDGSAPPLVLLDLSLPGISGLDVLQVLARGGALARSRVIMMSASATDDARRAARAAGAAAFLTKPVLPEHLHPWL